MGIFPGLKAFVAAVLGGIGNVFGAVIGGFILGITEYSWWPFYRSSPDIGMPLPSCC